MSNVINHTQPSGAAAGFGLLMSPQTIEQVQAFCLMLSKTDFVPKAFRGKPDSIMVVGAMGARLGVDVFSSMAGIADINGRPSVWGDLMLAVCMNQPQFEDCLESYEGTPYDDTFRAICVAKRKGREPVTRSFSVIEAKEAGLWKKQGPWTATPQRMLQMRARSFALRDTFADALAGFHSAEEMGDSILIDVTPSASVHAEPKVGKARTIKADAMPRPFAEKVTETSAVLPPAAEEESVVHLPTEEVEAVPDPMPKDMPAITMVDLQKQVADLWKTASGKQLVKDHMKTWKIAQISEVGGFDAGKRKEYFDRLNQTVAMHIQIKGQLQ